MRNVQVFPGLEEFTQSSDYCPINRGGRSGRGFGFSADDLRVSITNAAGENAYPISSYTYILAYLHIPTVLGAVVVTYNVASIAQPLQLSQDVLADIFLGQIKKLDDQSLTTEKSQ